MKKVYLLKNRYVDSVTLMTVAVELTEREGIDGAECGMGTKQNVNLLRELGYELPADATSNDVMIALDAQSEEPMRAACGVALHRTRKARKGLSQRGRSCRGRI